ncbi:hypothetical protein ACFQI7_05280 [Paenibacillus allorhizosphaerae]|uniref:Uncharacterized protein n=1 Tax=Paenibacillus allorhizosphaerae TaxID=2849866 RepID=A0ABM8VBT4_9BACL|nr:hypothetical protein [Paenibacillus allorhizosphaerae]CAG7621904.1 hypothetical protein PAECIP111802_00769 [Paenibacillus allorhizosphaerae]
MFTRDISFNRMISLILIMFFMVFATPTPTVEANTGETTRSVSQGTDYFVQQATVRKHASAHKSGLLAALFSALSLLVLFLMNAFCRVLRESHVSFRPQIARRLTNLLLSPIKFTSHFV